MVGEETGIDQIKLWEGLRMHDRPDQVKTLRQWILAPLFRNYPILMEEEHQVFNESDPTERSVKKGNFLMKVFNYQSEGKLPTTEELDEIAMEVLDSENPMERFSRRLAELKTRYNPANDDTARNDF